MLQYYAAFKNNVPENIYSDIINVEAIITVKKPGFKNAITIWFLKMEARRKYIEYL